MEICLSCGQTTTPDVSVCGRCGATLDATAGRSPAERPATTEGRPALPPGPDSMAPDNAAVEGPTVTVFFSDLKGSTSLGEKLDSEALREVLDRYFDAMTAELRRNGGTVEKFIGDAIMAVFGLPSPLPDDAARAVRAAAATKRALATLNDELEATYGVRLTNRTGLATGVATAGIERAGEHVLTGDVVRFASLLEQSAPPAEVLIAESTLHAVRAIGAEIVVEPVELPKAPPGSQPAFLLVEAPEADQATARRSDEAATTKVDETRRTVSVVFCDLRATDGDGAVLPPQRLRDALSQGFDVVRKALEHHGAIVEKYVGDAVMAVVGMPVLHEDDALRAVRAAASVSAAVEELSRELAPGVRLSSKIGVNTGEVVAGDAALGQRLVTGDTVNTAARLEQAAPEHAVLLGGTTYSLVRDAVDAEAVAPLSLKGKAELVAAYRLVGLRTLDGRPRAADGRMVGREKELDRLRALFHESVVQNGPRIATIVGDAGIGKSRLIRELERYVADMAVVLRGRCLSYGEGITFWPIIEIVRSAAEIEEDDDPVTAQRKIAELVGDAAVAERLGSILGFTAIPFPMAELFWSVRRVCQILAAKMPLVLVIDGVQWASPAFVELIDHLRTTLHEAPVLILLAARHELLEAEPGWGPGRRDTVFDLAPLTPDEAGQVLDALLGPGSRGDVLRQRILEVAQGNPLFLEQVVSMLIDTGALRFDDGRWVRADERGDVSVPLTIQALLAARVDAVPRGERQAMDRASVIGHSFAQPAVEALTQTDMRPDVPAALQGLETRQLIKGDTVPSASEPWYRFQNLLIRDAAYKALLKRSRIALHERFVTWADAVNRERGREREFEEISGYHLEQSYRYRRELGLVDSTGVAVGRDAARRLTSAGRRAFARGDMSAAANLLGRSVECLPADDAGRRELLPELGEAYLELGGFDRASNVLAEAATSAERADDARLAAHARLVHLLLDFYTGEVTGWSAKALREAGEAVQTFEAIDDHAGLTRAWRVLFGVHATACSYGEAATAADQIVGHATLAGDRRQEARGATGYAQAALLGPVPVAEAVERCHELMARVVGDRRTEAMILLSIAELEALEGAFESAREHAVQARSMLLDLGASVAASSTSINSWRAEALAGDLDAAETQLRRDYQALNAIGERFLLSTIAGLLGRIVLDGGRVDEASDLADRSRELADVDDVGSQALWRSLTARILARRGQSDAAVALASEALDVLRPADSPALRADALVDQADVLAIVGRRAEACSALLAARELYAVKGAAAAVDDVDERLHALDWPAVAAPA